MASYHQMGFAGDDQFRDAAGPDANGRVYTSTGMYHHYTKIIMDV